MYPVTLDELRKCQGVGDGKAQKFGGEFVNLIGKYVLENEIERPDDFVLKSTAAKSPNKISIIQSIDRRISLDDIADNLGMEMDQLLSEIESIVYSGTRLDLDYYIEDELDGEVVEELYEDFDSEAESDSLREAREKLGEDNYSDLELRVVRLKYLCDKGA